MRDWDWDDLKYFLAFARGGSMQSAATALGVNQSTVQRRLGLLEERTRSRLIERHPGGYRLTALGSDLVLAAEDVELAVSRFKRGLASRATGPTGTLRLTCGSAFASRMQAASLIELFRSRHPGISVELLVSDRNLDLSAGEVDVAIRRGEPTDNILIRRKIKDASWSVYASAAYLERYGRPKTGGTLEGHMVVGCDGPIAQYPGGQWARSMVPPALVATRSDSWQGLILAVKSGAGLAAVPRWQGDCEKDLIRVIDDIGVKSPYYLLMHRDLQNSPRVRAFADFVAAEIRSFRALLSGNTSA
jgi:DNA-binding transcriptional LysR family regulator